jgi:hypothetical protein
MAMRLISRLCVATPPQISGDALKGEVWFSGPLRLGSFVVKCPMGMGLKVNGWPLLLGAHTLHAYVKCFDVEASNLPGLPPCGGSSVRNFAPLTVRVSRECPLRVLYFLPAPGGTCRLDAVFKGLKRPCRSSQSLLVRRR